MMDSAPAQQRTLRQLISYILIGIATNLSGYLLYLLITYLGMAPTLSMTLLYWSVTIMGYFGNRRMTFANSETIWSTGSRYLLVYFIGYVFQYMMLVIFYEHLGYAHQIVQIAAAVFVTGFLFLAQKYFVFVTANS